VGGGGEREREGERETECICDHVYGPTLVVSVGVSRSVCVRER